MEAWKEIMTIPKFRGGCVELFEDGDLTQEIQGK